MVAIISFALLFASLTQHASAFSVQSSSRSSISSSVPYCIIKIDDSEVSRKRKRQFEEISSMCIDAFFNDGVAENDFVAPWKSLQLAYLRNAQYSDLMMRKFNFGRADAKQKNQMFVARRVVVLSDADNSSNNVSVSPNDVYNLDQLNVNRYKIDEVQLSAGEVLGFCEVTARPFGLGAADAVLPDGKNKTRPIITNLAVRADARRSGLGKALVSAVEDDIRTCWDNAFDEVVLQVEEDNIGGQRFYEKLGFEALFADPSCRRYDTSGIFLQQVRTTKICMRKAIPLGSKNDRVNDVSGSFGRTSFFGSNIIQSLRDAVMG